MRQPAESKLLSRLGEVVSAWPTGWRSGQPIPVGLQKLITTDFDASDLLHDLSGVAEVCAYERRGDQIIVEFLDKGGSVQRAIFISVSPDDWKLKSLTFQCPVCFGSGENLGAVCSICNGSGWGAD